MAENDALDLTVERVIAAPRARLWRAWTDPRRFELWWVPAPSRCRVDAMELAPGGDFRTSISSGCDGFVPHLKACMLVVDEAERLVFTDALTAGWRPAGEPFLTAEITLRDHPGGTHYRARALHRSPEDRADHERRGFFDGWTTVIAQLAELVEGETS